MVGTAAHKVNLDNGAARTYKTGMQPPPPKGPPPQLATMSSFVDFALATGAARVSTVGEDKKALHIAAADFYRPIRAMIARVGRERLDLEATYADLMLNIGDERQRRIFPAIKDGYAQFAAGQGPLAWVEPHTAALAAGPGLSIAVNPEVGYVIGGFPHHLKLHLRSEALTQKRVDFMIALMCYALPVDAQRDRLGVLDLRNARIWYLAPKSAEAGPWQKLRTLVAAEAAAFAECWARV